MIEKVVMVQGDPSKTLWCDQCARDGFAFLPSTTLYRVRVGSRSPFHLCRMHVDQLRDALTEATR